MPDRRVTGWAALYCAALLTWGCGGSGSAEDAGTSVLRFDFQDDTGPVASGFTRVTPADAYDAARGYGFVTPPDGATNGRRHTWTVFSETITVDEAVPGSVLSDATVDCVGSGGTGRRVAQARQEYLFRADVEPGSYDVTLWLGDVTTPRHQVRATVNGVVVDVERMDVNNRRGSFDETIFGTSVPRTVRVNAASGSIEVTVGAHPDGATAIEWTYQQDEDPVNPPYERTVVLVPAFSAPCLQALTLHPAADPPLRRSGDLLVQAAAPDEVGLPQALALFNAGDMAGARAAFAALSNDKTKAAGLFWIAGHPALLDEEVDLLEEAEALLAPLSDRDFAAQDLLLQVRLALDAERSRRLFGYAASESSATDNLGRSCSLVESFPDDHPYHWKGRILWLRNRGGLDPRRVTASWERAQWLARRLEPDWGGVNPYVHLYATDAWANEGRPWRVIDWAAVAGPGPDWARSLMGNMNGWLDLFEWWSIHRQSPEGDIGGGWTDDVEVVPAFGLMAFVLEGASDIARGATLRFADGIWNSPIIDRARGYQAQYADVEHTAEPTGNILHLHPLVRFGDPEGLERMLASGRTFAEFFLTTTSLGHAHFKGNHLSATQIATNPNHQADIPLCGRAVNPFSFLLWYSGNPGIETPLRAWIESWTDDAARTENRKPEGVFPQALWTPTDGIGYPGSGDWWSADATYGQFSDFPGYQYYLYNLAAWFHLRTGEAKFRLPLDRLREYTLAWADAGRPPPAAAPPVGGETIWCGAKLQSVARGAMTNAKIGSGTADWDAYVARFGDSYGRFLLDPTDAGPIQDLEPLAEELYAKWPYRTTEGVMTDRLLVVGWAEVISYYIGAEVFSVFFGMPVHAVTWENTTRLFAAAVTKASRTEIEASVYLFADQGRDVTLRLWQLEPGASYELEAGPAPGLGQPATSTAQTVAFVHETLGDGVTFTLPGRTTYALRIRRTAPAPGPVGPRADLAVAPRDVTLAGGAIRVRVHNVGAADAASVSVTVHDGLDATGAVIGSATIPSLPAPLDLVPRSAEVSVPWSPGTLPAPVTVVVAPQTEITPRNNVATAWLGGTAPELPPPMLIALDPGSVAPGGQATITGRNFVPGMTLLASGAPTALFTAIVDDAEHLTLEVDAGAPAGTYLLSLEDPQGKRSNLLPLEILD